MTFTLTTPSLDLKQGHSQKSVASVDLKGFVLSKVSAKGKRLAIGSLSVFSSHQSLETWLVGRVPVLDYVTVRTGPNVKLLQKERCRRAILLLKPCLTLLTAM